MITICFKKHTLNKDVLVELRVMVFFQQYAWSNYIEMTY
jgi:hypothetical protein